MTDPVTDPAPEDQRGDVRERAARERRRREVFGDVLDGATLDDRPDPPAGRGGAEKDQDDPGERWLRENVPPHHGG